MKIDIGCGHHKKEGFIGLDIDKNSQADIIGSALDLPLKDNSVDQIYCSHLVEHFTSQQVKIFFTEIYRVLKKGSQASLKVDHDWSKKKLLKKDPDHKHRYSVKELKKILQQFNFSQSEVRKKIYLFGFCLRNKIFIKLVK
ncbi:MAG: class I SAM-dependent methyltransferase [Nanoarchaeota archaeon]|nr:class I SAM-dependent methyltransferase [Nanoarchaeota archaeon]